MRNYLIVLVISFTTIVIRFLPFVLFKKKVPDFIVYLGKSLPACAMAMLVVYCFKNVDNSSILPSLVAGLTVFVTYKWKRSTGLSIVLGTIIYMIMVQNMSV